RDQQLAARTVEAGVLGRMPGADDHLPVVVADAQPVAVAQALVALGQRVDVAPEAAEAGAVGIDRLLVPAGAPVEELAVVGRLASRIGDQDAAAEVFEPRHPEPAAELAR